MAIQYAHLTWTPTALGASFLQYEIYRDEVGFGPGELIAVITTEAVAMFDDYEGRRNLQSFYIMRVVDVTFTPSLFTALGPFAEPLTDGCPYTFTSNEDPSFNIEYRDLRPREYEFPEDVEVLSLHNRDDVVVFRPTEDRGDAFTINLRLYTEGTPSDPTPTPGRRSFDPVIAIARAPLSYVCVLDSDANRWFAALLPGTARRDEPGGLYTMAVAVREVTETPSTPDAP